MICSSPAGKYGYKARSVDEDDGCESCPEGYYNNATGATSCSTLCPSGSYVTDDIADDTGEGVDEDGLYW